MSLHFIKDNKGKTTGVFIPIEEWETLKSENNDLQKVEAESNIELESWQKQIINDRLNEYYANPPNVVDFDKTIDGISQWQKDEVTKSIVEIDNGTAITEDWEVTRKKLFKKHNIDE